MRFDIIRLVWNWHSEIKKQGFSWFVPINILTAYVTLPLIYYSWIARVVRADVLSKNASTVICMICGDRCAGCISISSHFGFGSWRLAVSHCSLSHGNNRNPYGVRIGSLYVVASSCHNVDFGFEGTRYVSNNKFTESFGIHVLHSYIVCRRVRRNEWIKMLSHLTVYTLDIGDNSCLIMSCQFMS